MNNDLISSEYAKAKMFDIPKPKEGATFWDGVDTVGDIIDNATTVPHQRLKGEWITGGKDVTGQYFQDEFICNKCFTVSTDKSNFCPNCGADMRDE